MRRTAKVRRLEERIERLEEQVKKDRATIQNIAAARDQATRHGKQLSKLLNDIHGSLGLLTDGLAANIDEEHKDDYEKRMKHMLESK